jgi:LuxR family maltose regulon positive regulatory protein
MTDRHDFIFNQGIIRTKCNQPGITRRLVSRRRLSEKLSQTLDHKLTLVTAPAGYGKSTAVVDWLQKAGLPTAWVSLDSGDNHPMIFWRYICTALDNIRSGISNATSYVFSSPEFIKANIHLSILIDWLTTSQADLILVFDDFHFITEPGILENFSYFISLLPARVHVILISRTEPDMKLAKLVVKGDLVRLGLNDLRFQNEEIAQFYQIRGLFFEKEDIDRVEEYTEGWVAALVAATMLTGEKPSRNQGQLTESFGPSDQLIDKYLQEEVFSKWPWNKQAFLLKTSILERLCGPLCDAVTDSDNSNEKLQELLARNEFLISLDNEHQWYRYHPLFGNFLRKRLSEKDAMSIPSLHDKAAYWCRENGLLYPAIDHYLQAGRYDQAVLLISSQAGYLLPKGEYNMLLSWLERLPERFVRNCREIVCVMVSYYAEINSFDLAEQWLARLQEIVAEHRETESEAKITQKMYSLMGVNLLFRQGKLYESLLKIKEAAAIQGVTLPFNNEFMDINLFDISLYRGVAPLVNLFKLDKEAFLSLVANYRPMIGKNPGYAPLAIAEFYYENNRLGEALPYLLSSIDEATKADCPGALVPGMVTLARIKKAQNDLTAALEAVRECEQRLEKINKPHWNYQLNAFKTCLFLDAGQTGAVEEWFSNCKLRIYQEITRTREYELIVFARVLVERDRFEDAAILLQRLLAFAEGEKRLHSMVEIFNLLALNSDKTGETTSALIFLEKALSIGLQEGYFRSFIDESAPMAALLEKYLRMQKKRQEPADDNINQLIVYAKNLIQDTKNHLSKRALIPQKLSAVRTWIQCFGIFTLYQAGHPVNCKNSKAREILAFFVHNEGIAVGWEKIVEAIWPDFNYEKAHANFHATMYLLRKFLTDNSLQEILECSRGNYRIRPEKVDCDMYEFKRILTKYYHHPESDTRLLETARRLYAGGYFEEDGFGWAYSKAAELEAMYSKLPIEKITDHLLDTNG